MELGSDRLREPVVGGIPDQEMAEAEGVVSEQIATGRTNQLAADQCGELGADMRLRRLERPDGAAMEDLALHGAALQHAPLGLVELVEARLEEGTQGRRPVHLALLGGYREHLSQEERVAACRLRDAPAESGRQLVADQLLHVLRRQRLES